MVHYSCALGRKLFKYLPDETIMYDEANYTCQWDRTWWPDTEADRQIIGQAFLLDVYMKTSGDNMIINKDNS